MREKLHIDVPVIVEGKYDKITLSQIIDGLIFTTGGFSVFNSKEQQNLLRRICAQKGAILLTDSDGGGKQIRSFLLGILPKEKVIQLYVPKIEGKERRKRTASKSGLLGVEGMDADLLYDLFSPFASGAAVSPKTPVEKRDFFADGLTGRDGAAERRKKFCSLLSLPEDMTPNALLEAVNLLFGAEEYRKTVEAMENETENG